MNTESMTRQQCVDYLKAANDYAGRSRDSIERLREAVRLNQEVQAAANAGLYAEVANVPTDNPTATADPNPVERNRLAKVEWEALRTWAKAGRTPPRPATPNLDELEAEHQAAASGTKPTRRTAARQPKAEQAPPKVGAGIAVLELRNAGHGELVAKALANTLPNGADFVDGKYLLVPKANAQLVLDHLLVALDAKALGQFAKRQLVLATLLVRNAYPQVSDTRTNPVAKLVDRLNAAGTPWSVGWAADSTPTFVVGGVTYPTAKAASEAVAA